MAPVIEEEKVCSSLAGTNEGNDYHGLFKFCGAKIYFCLFEAKCLENKILKKLSLYLLNYLQCISHYACNLRKIFACQHIFRYQL